MALNWLVGILGQINEPRRGREALAGAAHHGLGKDARAPQMFGIGRIEPLLDGAHQQSAVGRSFSYYFRRHRPGHNVVMLEPILTWRSAEPAGGGISKAR